MPKSSETDLKRKASQNQNQNQNRPQIIHLIFIKLVSGRYRYILYIQGHYYGWLFEQLYYDKRLHVSNLSSDLDSYELYYRVNWLLLSRKIWYVC